MNKPRAWIRARRLCVKRAGLGYALKCSAGVIFSTSTLLLLGYFTPRRVQPSTEACAVTIYVSGDRFHANLTLPVKTDHFDWRQQLNLTELGQQQRRDYRYLSFGWGDRQFYLNTPELKDLKLTTTLRAFLIPTNTTMHVQGHHQLPQSNSGYQVQAVQLSQSNYEQLTAHVLASFARDTAKRPILLQKSHRYTGTFYIGVGRYGFWQTCNDWLAQGLRIANSPTPIWSGLAGSIFQHLDSNCVDDS